MLYVFFSFPALVVIAFLGWRALARASVTSSTSIPPGGLSILEKITLGGVDQWILIRAHDPNADVLLFVHGGPGLPNMPLCHLQAGLERHFVVVQWDQRGAGKSYSPDLPPESIEIDRFVTDAAELTDRLRDDRFGKKRIFLLGHSWGSVVGLKTVSRYPGRFAAYIGVSQVTSVMAAQHLVYRNTLEKAEDQGIVKAIDELKRIGPPPFSNPSDHIAACRWFAKLEGHPARFKVYLGTETLRSPYYSLGDCLRLRKGANLAVAHLWEPLEQVDLRSEVRSLPVPVVFIQGASDSLIPGELIERYIETLVAPAGKKLTWLKESGHLPHLEQPDAFVNLVVDALSKY